MDDNEDIVERLQRAAVGFPQDEMNQTAADEITLIGRTFTPATNDGRQGWEFRYVDHQPYPVWFGTESTDLTRHLAAALDEIVRLRAGIDEIATALECERSALAALVAKDLRRLLAATKEASHG